ncbi:hypothetical protein YOLOSWAG_240 [Erwinia phage vB_EamM_Yoloswag]|uniref:Uncharacterized protein n=1 Tax=Erwinia phage vB_EamM_Yoloswag TaxID=1958956 RepID=A0A1S6L3G2_9CAUD|nr:hypothetical protein HOR66_gp240 [Erwinia phage vB_EamM_Yoloswag]AQT28717.1 hypothetical protein YOLOSWAG_240 [Erwinia phage vB_EamM_Yoloswag]
MSDKPWHLEIHDSTISNNFSIGMSRKHMTAAFEKYIEKNSGQIPFYAFSFEEFCRWAGDRHVPWKDKPVRASVMHSVNLIYGQFLWSFTKGCFSPEKGLLEYLINSELPKTFPVSMLRRLPHWSQWINTNLCVDYTSSGTMYSIESTGFWATYCMIEGRTNLSLFGLGLFKNGEQDREIMNVQAMFEIEEDRPIEDTLETFMFLMGSEGRYGVEETHPDYENIRDAIIAWVKQAANIILFVSSQVDDLYKGGVKQVQPRRKGKSYKLMPVAKERNWSVGTEFLNPIREYEKTIGTMTSIQKRAAHIRRGHYHSFWRGPRDGQRELFSKWLPPTVVRGTLET